MWQAGDICSIREFGWQAIHGLIGRWVGRRYLIYRGVWELGDIPTNRGFGRQAIYQLIVGLANR